MQYTAVDRDTNAPRTRTGIQGAADEESVDVDEPRDPQPNVGSRPPVISAAVRLSPVQEAWGGYATHTLGCPACRDVDQQCEESERLYREWQGLAGEALRRIGDAAP